MLEVLDPAQNHTFRDHYLEIPIDLSKVLFIATANQLGHDPSGAARSHGADLAERLHRGRQGPHRADVPDPAAARRARAEGDQIEITDAAVRRVIAEYTREAGVRTLERQIGTIARKVAARVATDERIRRTVDAPNVTDYLGPARFRSEAAFRTSRPGVATGLAWTETGGDVLFIEAVALPGGGGRLTLTGQLGQRDAGVGARRAQPRPAAGGRAADLARVPGQAGPPRPRPCRRDPERRPVGGRHDGDRDRLGGARRAGARRMSR